MNNNTKESTIKQVTYITLKSILYAIPIGFINYAIGRWFDWGIGEIITLTIIYTCGVFIMWQK